MCEFQASTALAKPEPEIVTRELSGMQGVAMQLSVDLLAWNRTTCGSGHAEEAWHDLFQRTYVWTTRDGSGEWDVQWRAAPAE